MAGNPFRYGDVATGKYFTNRVRELAEVRADIQSGQNIVIISPRRYGKTSLIIQAMEGLRTERVLVAYLDLFRAPTKDRFADLLADAIYAGLINPAERAVQSVADLIRRLPIQPKVTIGADGSPSFEFSATVLDAESARYVTLWDTLTAHQRLVLIALSTDAGPIYSEEYRRDHRLGAAYSVQRSLTRLQNRELVESVAASGYRINDAFLRAWIVQRAVP